MAPARPTGGAEGCPAAAHPPLRHSAHPFCAHSTPSGLHLRPFAAARSPPHGCCAGCNPRCLASLPWTLPHCPHRFPCSPSPSCRRPSCIAARHPRGPPALLPFPGPGRLHCRRTVRRQGIPTAASSRPTALAQPWAAPPPPCGASLMGAARPPVPPRAATSCPAPPPSLRQYRPHRLREFGHEALCGEARRLLLRCGGDLQPLPLVHGQHLQGGKDGHARAKCEALRWGQVYVMQARAVWERASETE